MSLTRRVKEGLKVGSLYKIKHYFQVKQLSKSFLLFFNCPASVDRPIQERPALSFGFLIPTYSEDAIPASGLQFASSISASYITRNAGPLVTGLGKQTPSVMHRRTRSKTIVMRGNLSTQLLL